jgi:hypothetical protein
VEWELKYIQEANLHFVNFEKNTMSPITLMELGIILCSDSLEIIVVCPDGFWRKGNVDVTCEYFGLRSTSLCSSLDEGIKQLINYFYHLHNN